MPKAIKKKVSRKSVEVGVEDRLADIKEMYGKRQKQIAMYGITSLLAISVVAGGFIYRNAMDKKAQQLAYEGYKMYTGDAKLPDQERFQKALDLFQKSYSTKKSAATLLYIANSYYEMARYDDALKSLDEIITNYPSAKEILPLAYRKKAAVQLKKGNKEEALKTLDQLSKLSSAIYRDVALMESARILEGEGKKEEAIKKYKELTEQLKDSPFVEEAKSRMAVK